MANVRDAVNAVITAIMAQKDYLTAVDAKTGDGDHGLNMARGFAAAKEQLADLPPDAPVKDVLYHIGRAFIENVYPLDYTTDSMMMHTLTHSLNLG